MHYFVPAIVILGFSVVLTVGLLSVMQDLLERTAESPLIRESEAHLVQLVEDGARRGGTARPSYVARGYGDNNANSRAVGIGRR